MEVGTMELFKAIVKNQNSYWVIQRNNNQIILIGTEHIKNLVKDSLDLKLTEYESFLNTDCDLNMFISPLFPPFQIGISCASFQKGFPIPNNVKSMQFYIDCLSSGLTDIFDLEKLIMDFKEDIRDE